MGWLIVVVVVAAVIAVVAFRATGREPLKDAEADEQRDGRDRMI